MWFWLCEELDPEGKGTVHLDKISDYLNGKLAACLDDRALTEAFELFDSDKDGKINLEEFEFFMNSFARDMNSLRGNKIVQEMMQQSARYADKKTKLFEISRLVEVLKGTWQVWLVKLIIIKLKTNTPLALLQECVAAKRRSAHESMMKHVCVLYDCGA